jgi:hypothetical protein
MLQKYEIIHKMSKKKGMKYLVNYLQHVSCPLLGPWFGKVDNKWSNPFCRQLFSQWKFSTNPHIYITVMQMARPVFVYFINPLYYAYS